MINAVVLNVVTHEPQCCQMITKQAQVVFSIIFMIKFLYNLKRLKL